MNIRISAGVILLSWVILLSQSGAVNAQSDDWAGLGQALSTVDIGTEVSTDKAAPSWVSNASFGGQLDPGVLKARLQAVMEAPEANLRGAAEVALYADLSPSVVLIVTDDSLGSGAVINQDGLILTNWHVIRGSGGKVGVIYKPEETAGKLSNPLVYTGVVTKFDEVADLALVEVPYAPAYGKKPLKFGSISEVPIGSDVHAIGHPTGQTWTYTKGIVSQIRRQFEWSTEEGKDHLADVIQTQTPINPGNSGGPLISDNRTIVGINSFSRAESEGLNFAVSVDELRRFVDQRGNRYAGGSGGSGAAGSVPAECEGGQIGPARRSSANNADLYAWDFDCDGGKDAVLVVPDDQSEGTYMLGDANKDGRVDAVIVDSDRDGFPNFVLYDTDGDGDLDLRGWFRKGEDEPYRFEPYSE